MHIFFAAVVFRFSCNETEWHRAAALYAVYGTPHRITTAVAECRRRRCRRPVALQMITISTFLAIG